MSDTPGAGWTRHTAATSSPNVGPTAPSRSALAGIPVSSSSSAAAPGGRIASIARTPAPAMSTTPTATVSPSAMGTSLPPFSLSSTISRLTGEDAPHL